MAEEHFELIVGRITIRFARLEFFLDAAIWMLMGNKESGGQQRAQLITLPMNFGKKVELFKDLFKLAKLGADAEAGLEDTLRWLRAAAQSRNLVAHTVWRYAEEIPGLMGVKAVKADEGPRHRVTHVPMEEFELHLQRIYGAEMHLGLLAGMEHLRQAYKTGGRAALLRMIQQKSGQADAPSPQEK